MTILTEKTNEVVRHTMITTKKGSVNISIFNEGNTKILIGFKNPKGMGYFKNLNTLDEIQKEINGLDDIIWLTKEEQSQIKNIMEEVK